MQRYRREDYVDCGTLFSDWEVRTPTCDKSPSICMNSLPAMPTEPNSHLRAVPHSLVAIHSTVRLCLQILERQNLSEKLDVEGIYELGVVPTEIAAALEW